MYRFRAAEEANASNLIALKREMEFLGRKLEYRQGLLGNRLRDTPNGLSFQGGALSRNGSETSSSEDNDSSARGGR